MSFFFQHTLKSCFPVLQNILLLVLGGSLYGAYGNALSTVGVSALWHATIATVASAVPSDITGCPVVMVEGSAVLNLSPNNLVLPATHMVFYEKGSKSGVINEEEAVKR